MVSHASMTERVGAPFALRTADAAGSTAVDAVADGRLAVEKSCMNSSSGFLLNSMMSSPWVAWVVTNQPAGKDSFFGAGFRSLVETETRRRPIRRDADYC